jgi:hypothetical protein
MGLIWSDTIWLLCVLHLLATMLVQVVRCAAATREALWQSALPHMLFRSSAERYCIKSADISTGVSCKLHTEVWGKSLGHIVCVVPVW